MSVFRFISYWINTVLDHFQTQEMRDKEIKKDPWSLLYIPDHLKTQEICNKTVEKDSFLK